MSLILVNAVIFILGSIVVNYGMVLGETQNSCFSPIVAKNNYVEDVCWSVIIAVGMAFLAPIVGTVILWFDCGKKYGFKFW